MSHLGPRRQLRSGCWARVALRFHRAMWCRENYVASSAARFRCSDVSSVRSHFRPPAISEVGRPLLEVVNRHRTGHGEETLGVEADRLECLLASSRRSEFRNAAAKSRLPTGVSAVPARASGRSADEWRAASSAARHPRCSSDAAPAGRTWPALGRIRCSSATLEGWPMNFGWRRPHRLPPVSKRLSRSLPANDARLAPDQHAPCGCASVYKKATRQRRTTTTQNARQSRSRRTNPHPPTVSSAAICTSLALSIAGIIDTRGRLTNPSRARVTTA